MRFRVSVVLAEPKSKGEEYAVVYRGAMRTIPFKTVITVFESLEEVVDFVQENGSFIENISINSI